MYAVTSRDARIAGQSRSANPATTSLAQRPEASYYWCVLL